MTPLRYNTCQQTHTLHPAACDGAKHRCSGKTLILSAFFPLCSAFVPFHFFLAQKLDFISLFGLTTRSRHDELVQQKRRKRRRLLRERSPSPSVSQSKRTPPPPPLSTRFTPEEMDQAPELEDKKRFLTAFRLSHVTVQQRRGRRLSGNTHSPTTRHVQLTGARPNYKSSALSADHCV